MAENDLEGWYTEEEIENYQPKCSCILVLDTSSSMASGPITELNNGLSAFHDEILGDPTTKSRLEVAIVTFDSQVKLLVKPQLATNLKIPKLLATGTTKLADGVLLGIATIKKRKQWYKETGQPYFRPWIILITDGVPDKDQDINNLRMEIQKGVELKEFHFFAIAVQGADMDLLEQISSKEMKPQTLKGIRFIEFFKWLSASMEIATKADNKSDLIEKILNNDGFDWKKI